VLAHRERNRRVLSRSEYAALDNGALARRVAVAGMTHFLNLISRSGTPQLAISKAPRRDAA